MENLEYGGGMMRISKIPLVSGMIWVWVVFNGFCTDCTAQKTDSQAQLEDYLKTARQVEVDVDENLGSTEPWTVWLDDGQTRRRAIFKHVPRCRPHFLPDCYKYEIAAYELSKLLDLPIVPPVVERTINNTPGALQIFVDDCVPLNNFEKLELADPDTFHKNMLDILVFDNLTYWQTGDDDLNEDIFVHPADSKVWRVDFSKAFKPVHNLLPDRSVKHCSLHLCQALIRVKDAQIREKLRPYLNPDEIEALIARKDILIRDLVPTL